MTQWLDESDSRGFSPRSLSLTDEEGICVDWITRCETIHQSIEIPQQSSLCPEWEGGAGMKRVLITGGAGFIGSAIAIQLSSAGIEVIALDNLSSGYRINVDGVKGVRLVEMDIRDVAIEPIMEGVDTVFHLAASVGNKRSIDDPITDAEVNVIGTLRVLEAARKAKVRKVVMSSSAGIFGELKTLPISEGHPVEPDSPYGATKLCAEKECLAYGKLYDMEVVCLRYFNVYGPRQRFDAYGNAIPIFVFQMYRGEPITIFGDGEQTRDFVNVNDVAQANIKAASAKGISGAFNIGSGTRISINALVDFLSVASGTRPVVRHGAPRPGDVRDSLADISAARNAFGFDPSVELTAGLTEYVGWVQKELHNGPAL
jgi:UDP-glucose 4-epimerase